MKPIAIVVFFTALVAVLTYHRSAAPEAAELPAGYQLAQTKIPGFNHMPAPLAPDPPPKVLPRVAGTIAEIDGVKYELDETLTNWVNVTEMEERREKARQEFERRRPMNWSNLPQGVTAFGIWTGDLCLFKSLVLYPPTNVVFAFPHKPTCPELTNGVWVIRFEP